MYQRKFLSVLLSALLLLTTMGTALAAVPDTADARLAAVEQAAYGQEQTGALSDRIVRLEKELELTKGQSSMMDRVNALYNRMFDNTSAPSLMTQMNAIEWSIEHKVSMDSIQNRITVMETTINGKPATGTFQSRIDKLATFAFGSKTVPVTQVNVPANTLVKISLITPVSSKNIKKGDIIQYQVAEDVVQNGMLIFAKGAPGEGTVTKVEPARNFGRDAEVVIDFRTARAVDGTTVDMMLGEESRKEMKTMAMAAGASIAGIVVLGPIGVVAGAFVNGKNINLPAGTELYIQTKGDTTLYGIPTTTQQ